MFNSFFFGNRAVYEILWRNYEKPDRPEDNITRRIRIACWIPKHTLRICSTYFLSIATMVARMRLDVTLYGHCLSCDKSSA